jgi:hypothetical protein
MSVGTTILDNMSCFTSSSNQVQLANSLAAQLTSQAQTNAGFVFGWAINTTAINQNSVQEIVNSQMVSTIESCANQFGISQEVDVSGSYNDIVNSTLSQQGTTFAQCVFGSTNVDTVSNNISTQMNAVSDTSTSTLSDLITLIIIAAIIAAGGGVAIAVINALVKKNQNKTPSTTNSPNGTPSIGTTDSPKSTIGSKSTNVGKPKLATSKPNNTTANIANSVKTNLLSSVTPMVSSL